MSFYDRLSSIVDAISTRDHLFLCGDFSATLPVDKVCVKNRCGEANRNTKMLQSFIERHDLHAANTYTRQKHRSLPTFDGQNVRKTRLVWTSCPLRYRLDLQKFNTLKISVITSDHRFITASFSLKWPVRKSRSKQIDWISLITPDIRSTFIRCPPRNWLWVRLPISCSSSFGEIFPPINVISRIPGRKMTHGYWMLGKPFKEHVVDIAKQALNIRFP